MEETPRAKSGQAVGLPCALEGHSAHVHQPSSCSDLSVGVFM